MAPQPKRKHSKGKVGRRRSHDAIRPVHLVECPQCHHPRRPHTVCLNCGSYEGVEVIPLGES